jgi:hypothetical protein
MVKRKSSSISSRSRERRSVFCEISRPKIAPAFAASPAAKIAPLSESERMFEIAWICRIQSMG